MVAVIDPNVTAMQLSKGAASEVAAEYTSDAGLDSLLIAVEPGTVFTQTALFIDVKQGLPCPHRPPEGLEHWVSATVSHTHLAATTCLKRMPDMFCCSWHTVVSWI